MIVCIGAGPGSLDYMTQRGADLIRAGRADADVRRVRLHGAGRPLKILLETGQGKTPVTVLR